jgi:polyisoprenoid-binding protein YceI
LALVCLSLLCGPLLAAPARYELDTEHLTIAFLGEHIGYAKTLGSFRKASGSYVFDDSIQALSELRVVVETASVDTGHERRDRHLRSADFLASAEFPRMTFTAASGRAVGNGRYVIDGQLELRGVTRPLTLEATVNKIAPYPIGDKDIVMGVSARGSLKRSDFGMTYAVENALVGDVVELLLEFEARRR